MTDPNQYPDTCPHCDADLQGAEIPERIRQRAGRASRFSVRGNTRFSRVIGIYDMKLDRTTTWHCPDCGGEWPREES